MMISLRRSAQTGFTLVELLIATSVFSIILLIMTFGILQISRTYYKGVGLARTQEVARTISDEIAQAIQFGGDSIVMPNNIVDGTQARCIGGREFNYLQYRQVARNPVGQQAKHGLVINDNSCGSMAQPIAGAGTNPTGRALVPERMRLTTLQVTRIGSTDLYNVQVGVGYGDNSAFIDRNSDGQINGGDAPMECKDSRSESQFCATSELNTTVQKRVN